MDSLESDDGESIDRLGNSLWETLLSELVAPSLSAARACPTCFGVNYTDELHCTNCNTNTLTLLGATTPVFPVSLYRRPSVLRECLSHYKSSDDHIANPNAADAIGRILATFLRANDDALALKDVDALVVVPSTSRPAPHPLELVLAAYGPSLPPVVALLERTTAALSHTHPHSSAFVTSRSVAGLKLLLIDDVYTTGARGQSAHSVLVNAGASVQALVVVGRRINTEYHPNAAELWSACAAAQFRWDNVQTASCRR